MTKVKHIETDGCIVNIRTGLTDMHGYKVTSIEILCDNLPGAKWALKDYDNAQSISIRVVEAEQ